MQNILSASKWVTIIVLLAALGVQTRVQHGRDENHDRVVRVAERQIRTEGWVGRDAPLAVVGTSGSTTRFRVFWVVDVDRCADCTLDGSNWNTLAESGKVETTLLLSTPDSGRASHFAKQIANVSRSGMVSQDFIDTHFGLDVASFRILVDDEGIIIAADSRRPNSQCRWSFIGQVAAVLDPELDLPITNGQIPSVEAPVAVSGDVGVVGQ